MDFTALSWVQSECLADVSDEGDESDCPFDTDQYRSVDRAVKSHFRAPHFEPQESWQSGHSKQKGVVDPFARAPELVSGIGDLWAQPQSQPQPQPPSEPHFLNKQTTLTSEDDAATLFVNIQNTLNDCKSFFKSKPEKFKFKVFGDAEFSIRLYRGVRANVAIEFHRTAGCHVTFHSCFRRVCSALASRVRTYNGELILPPTQELRFSNLRAPASGSDKVALARSAAQCAVGAVLTQLCAMAIGGCMQDQQKQAYAELVDLCFQHVEVLKNLSLNNPNIERILAVLQETTWDNDMSLLSHTLRAKQVLQVLCA